MPASTPSIPPRFPATNRIIALVGLMGVGKSTVGRRLGARLRLPFADGDDQIERAAGMSVSDIFSKMGEQAFRDGEARVMKRLLEGPPMVLATGGGAILNPDTRALLEQYATTVWLKADLAVVASRVLRRDTRPLLRGKDPVAALTEMAQVRYPIYALSDLTVGVGGGSHAEAVEAIFQALLVFDDARAGQDPDQVQDQEIGA